MPDRITKTASFSPEAIALLDDLQARFNLADHEAVIKQGIKLMAIADKWPLYAMVDGVLTEVEIGDE